MDFLPSGIGPPYYSVKVVVSTNYGREEARNRAIRDIHKVHPGREVVIESAEILDTWES